MRELPSDKQIIIGLLLALAVINVAWLVLSSTGDPSTFALLYALAAWVVGQKEYFFAAMAMALVGLLLHTYEWAINRITLNAFIDQLFFSANLLLPLPLLFFSIRTTRRRFFTVQ
jgi:steroid 5-alpha reductase family enzyme